VTERDHPIETPFHQKVEDFKRRQLPLIVWSLAALACLLMLTGRAGRFEYIGLARAIQYEISATTTGQLEALVVDLYDAVESGDILAKLDDAEIDARIERAQATIRRLTAELDAAKTQITAANRLDKAGWASDLRRFQTDEEDRRLATLELRVTIEGDEIEGERLALELDRAAPLLASGLMGQAEYDDVRLLHDAVTSRIETNKILLQQTQEELRAAGQRREEFERTLPGAPAEEPLLAPLREAVEVESQRLREIQARRQATVLRSPISGQVSSILCRRGQTVVPGEPILTVTERTVTEILAYLDESDRRDLRENAPVLLSSLAEPSRVAESFVTRVGPDLQLLPERLWSQPATPQYGRAVVIAAVPGLRITPGELLSVKFPER
jgi:multidrug resistance efflux pump